MSNDQGLRNIGYWVLVIGYWLFQKKVIPLAKIPPKKIAGSPKTGYNQ